jgi:multiple sugar transport system permease protein
MPARLSLWRQRLGVAVHRWGPGYILVAPVVVMIVVMMIVPTLQTALFSVSKVQLPAMDTTFIGPDNYLRFLSNSSTGSLIQRTLFWVVATVALRFVMGFAAALVFNTAIRGTRWMRVLVFIPWAIPSVVAASLWRWVLQTDAGVINDTLRYWGASGLAQNWLGNPDLTLLLVVLAYSWAGFPFVMLFLLAGLQGIPQEYREAAQCDGANSWQVFRHITVPSMSGIIGIILLLETIMAINAFDMLFVMAGGGPADATTIFSLAVFDKVFTDFDYGGASAMSMVLFAVFAAFFVLYRLLNARVQRASRRRA